MGKLMNWLVVILLIAVVVLSVTLWNVHQSTARIEHYITKPDGLAAWMKTEPDSTRVRLDNLTRQVLTLCTWSQKSAPTDLKCVEKPGGGGTNDPPKPGPDWP